MMRSSDTNPYIDELSIKDNLLAAIELAKLSKSFAEKAQTDKRTGIKSSQWIEVITKLEDKLSNYTYAQG